MTLESGGGAVRSVDRAAALLLALGESPAPAGVTELANRLGLHKSTASRLLATLERRGLVEQDGATGKYRLGLVVIRLADRAERTLDLGSIAQPELEQLVRVSGAPATLGVLDADQLLVIGHVGGASDERQDPTGLATPLHCVAGGKVLLAALAEREVIRIARRGLDRYTERTTIEIEALLEELARVRRRGYATEIGEYDETTNAVASGIRDARGHVVAAIEVRAPAARLTTRRLPEIAAEVRAAASAVSLHLGWAVA